MNEETYLLLISGAHKSIEESDSSNSADHVEVVVFNFDTQESDGDNHF